MEASHRSFSAALTASLALALLLCLSAPPAQAAEDEERVDNPQYQSWATHQPGTQVVLEMKSSMLGRDFVMEVTQTLVEVKPDKVVVESASKSTISGAPGSSDRKTKKDIAAKVKKSEAQGGQLPPGTSAEFKEAGTETVTVLGKPYECKVIEFSGKDAQGMSTTGKLWNTTDLPGGMAKMESTSSGEGMEMKMAMTLKKVETK